MASVRGGGGAIRTKVSADAGVAIVPKDAAKIAAMMNFLTMVVSSKLLL
jgi:hypothetical protein